MTTECARTATAMAAVLMAVAAVTPGLAQPGAAASADDIIVTGVPVANLAKVTSASRLGLTLLQTPASVDSIDGDAIRARGDLTVQEAVSRATGITFVGTPGNGNTALTARGFSGQGSIQLLVDGTRLYVASGTLTFPIDPWQAERIDVLRGPTSVLFGEGAVGGSINVVMKKPTDRPIYQAQFGYGTNNTARVGVDAGGPIGGGLSYRIAASYQRSSGWLDRNDHSRNVAVSGSLRYDAAPNLNFLLASDYGNVKILPYFGTPLVAGKLDERFRRTQFNIDDPQDNFKDSWTRLNAEWGITDNITFHNTAFYLQSDRYYKNSETYSYVAATGRVTRGDYLNIIHHQRQYGDRADVTLRMPLGSVENTLVVGADINKIKFRHVNNSPYGGTSSVDPFNFAPGGFLTPVPTIPGFRTDTDQHSVFVEDNLKLTSWLSLVGGVRRDWFDLTRIDQRVAANSFQRDFRSTSWRGGVVATLAPSTTVYGQYTTGVDPISALITTSTAQRTFGLSPARQIEAGFKHQFAEGRGSATFAAYEIVKRRLLTVNPLNRLETQQVGKRSSKGVEASVSYQLTPTLSVDANAALIRARFDTFDETVGTAVISRAGNTPPGVPKRTANLGAAWEFLPKLQARINARFVSRRFIDNANTLRLPGYEIFDAGLRYQLTERLALDARLSNAFDKVYPLTGNGSQWLLGTPRRVDVRLDARF